MSDNPLGEKTEPPPKYDPGILYSIPRWPARSLLDIDKKILMYGLDHWHAYELSWLDDRGKPQIAIGEFFFNSASENIIESKSLKLYLNSYDKEQFTDSNGVRERIVSDLSAISCSEVKVELYSLRDVADSISAARIGKSIDAESIESVASEPDESLLAVEEDVVFDEELHSDLFRSNCPVTGQPDWASFDVQYTGSRINPASLLSYLCSYHDHQGYHEECAERIYRDIMLRCKPTELRISLNFLRRGGIDINVYRSTQPVTSDSVNPRLIRQ